MIQTSASVRQVDTDTLQPYLSRCYFIQDFSSPFHDDFPFRLVKPVLESLYWLVRPRKDRSVGRDDVLRAFNTYQASNECIAVHGRIRDYLGDENVRCSVVVLVARAVCG